MKVAVGETQTESAYQALRKEILSGSIAPGERLPINEITARIGVSIGAVREALARLAAEDLAIATAQKGYSVPAVSAEDLSDLTEMRILIEGECLQNAIQNADLDFETALVAAFHRLSNLPERNPDNHRIVNPAWLNAHQVFHESLVAACKNTWLLRVRKMLFNQSERYRRLSVSLAHEERDVNAEHEAIFKAAMRKDVPAARELLAQHIRLTSEILLSSGQLSERKAS